jgi:hypothetical protein
VAVEILPSVVQAVGPTFPWDQPGLMVQLEVVRKFVQEQVTLPVPSWQHQKGDRTQQKWSDGQALVPQRDGS